MSSPRLIAFEGVDGAGKTTVLSLVAQALRQRGERVFLPRAGKEHSSQPTRMIRRLTRDARNFELGAASELLLYCAREAQVVEELIRPALADGQTVLVDRSFLTPIVIGAFGRGLERQWCESTARAASLGCWPDVTLLFDVHPRTSRLRKRVEKVRSHAESDRGRKGLSGSGFKERIRDGYLQIGSEAGYPVFHAERATPDVVAERVVQFLVSGVRPEKSESPDDGTPNWMVDPDSSFSEAVDGLPAPVALFMSNGLAAGRQLRARYQEQEPDLVAWALDATDPLRRQLVVSQPEYSLRGLSRCPLGDAKFGGPEDLRLSALASAPDAALRGLRGVACEASDTLRRQYAVTQPGAVLASLAGRQDALALALRAECWKPAELLDRVAALVGCDDEDAWQRREKLFDKAPQLAVDTLRWLSGARVNAHLERLSPYMPKLVLRAITGRDDEFASALRRDLQGAGREVIESTTGVGSDAAWALRAEWAESSPSTVLQSMRGFERDPRYATLLAQCKQSGRGDIHTLRRVQSLVEYPDLPQWKRGRAAAAPTTELES